MAGSAPSVVAHNGEINVLDDEGNPIMTIETFYSEIHAVYSGAKQSKVHSTLQQSRLKAPSQHMMLTQAAGRIATMQSSGTSTIAGIGAHAVHVTFGDRHAEGDHNRGTDNG
eukprot:6457923-Amphidinium_carterae.2